MKKKSFKTLTYSLLASIFLISSVSWSMPQKITETKEIKKEFTVNSDATLTLDNQYGNINVHSWDQDKVEIIVDIQVEGRKMQCGCLQVAPPHVRVSYLQLEYQR